MLFNSATFIIFLFLVVILYWSLPHKPGLYVLFISSYVFYGFWRIEFLSLVIISTLVDYFAGLKIYSSQNQKHKKYYLFLSLFMNLGLLVYFKYLLFIIDNFNSTASLLGLNFNIPHLNIILPLGISFYTFQTISYSVDVYRGFIKPEKNFVTYATYVSFFPQLVAGPILRAGEVINQLKSKRSFNIENINIGIRRVLYGLFLKVVLADNISQIVDTGFSQNISFLSAIDVWTLAFLFGFQIYFDFSAYSHIALGSARLIGIEFPENFNFPYLATSPRDFWKRWHISLSSWIRDYLYLPISGRKVLDTSKGGLATAADSKQGKLYNFLPLFITWAIMGLWHGANWTFVFWGIYHAFLIAIYRLTSVLHFNISSKVKGFLGWGFTLLFSMLGWIPFRAKNLDDTFKMLGKVFNPYEYNFLGLRENDYLIAALIMISVLVAYFISKNLKPIRKFTKLIYPVAEIVQLVIIIILVFTFLRPISQFIYFQF
ncbi:MAG TPA: MBOAT family O-acyltransferase [Ignavibacteriaceae bacterium]|nr:MBOAT family O-acyltransferase [Ignavibacteriaceae bacterium]